jgi:hypothetical protein
VPLWLSDLARSPQPTDGSHDTVLDEHRNGSTSARQLPQPIECQYISLDVVFDEWLSLPLEMLAQLRGERTAPRAVKFDVRSLDGHRSIPP